MAKAVVLTGHPDCPNVVTFSMYDTQLVHFLSTACMSLKWREKEKRVYDKDAMVSVMMKFLCAEVNDDYNNGMNNVDITDQLHGTYQFDFWMQKRKWWWAIWMWGVQVLMVNAYILYKTSHLIIWHKDERTLLSHYEFHRQLALAWVGSPKDAPINDYSMADWKLSWDDASSTTSSGKSTRINDTTLDPLKGTL